MSFNGNNQQRAFKTVLRIRRDLTTISLGLVAALLCSPVLCLSQPSLATQQEVLDELKAMRSSLERLETGQKALLAVLRIEIDERRAEALDARRQRLIAQERDLARQIREAAEEIQSEEAGGPTVARSLDGEPEPVTSAAAARQEQAEMKAEEVRRLRQDIEREIDAIRKRIAAMEKRLDEVFK
jgi:hypothetical protein